MLIKRRIKRGRSLLPASKVGQTEANTAENERLRESDRLTVALLLRVVLFLILAVRRVDIVLALLYAELKVEELL